ncbi:Hypothetical predicted protein [Olea europaea subsp. europaea]|uniref:Uncharacterized protein n=1 Tax=Olea europaea subsp. europaea TaxID=158383 RepID=A0A8S0VHY1_OLEEU|nr:Hypothetical predicted protein [Olea europaea subsp. europaea]
MKIFVKTLKGTHFEIEVKPEDKELSQEHSEVAERIDGGLTRSSGKVQERNVLSDPQEIDNCRRSGTCNKSSSGEGSTTLTGPALKAQPMSATPPTSAPTSTALQAPAVAPAPVPAPASAPVSLPAHAPPATASDL